MTDTPRLWDRRADETPKSYEAFRVYCDLGARGSIGDAIQKTLKTLPSESQLVQWKRWSRKFHWVSRKLARAEWMARTADEDAQTYRHECYRALTAVAYKFITSEDPERVRVGSAIIKDHYPPPVRVADVSERIEDLSDIQDADLERMKAIRDAARAKAQAKVSDGRDAARAERLPPPTEVPV